MEVRIEFAGSDSSAFKQALAVGEKLASFKRTRRKGLTLYSVEFSGKDLETFDSIHEHLLSCERVAVYIDGNLVEHRGAFGRARKALEAGQETDEAVEDLMRRVNQDMKERQKLGDVIWPAGKEDDKELDDE